MVILREYKSVVFWLMFVSLWIIGCLPKCNDEEAHEIKETENTNENKQPNEINQKKQNNKENNNIQSKNTLFHCKENFITIINNKKIEENNKKTEGLDNNIKKLKKRNEELSKENSIIKNKNLELIKKNEEIIKAKEEIKKAKDEFQLKEKELNEKNEKLKKKEKEIIQKKKEENIKLQNKENLIKKKEMQIDKKIKDYELKRKQDEDEYNKKNQQLIIKEKDLIRREDSIIWSKKPILVGLNNIGATCYMNATLQCLSNTQKLTEYFLKTYKDNSNNVMSNEYHKVLSNLWRRENHNKAYSPNSFKETLSQENPLFAGIQANDSKDLINFLIERFHQELNIIKKNPNNNITMTQEDQTNEQMMLQLFLNEFAQNFNSPISNLFYGILETKSQCQGCKVIKFNFQIYSFLEFPLQQVNQFCFNNGKRPLYTIDGKNPDVNLYECFDYNGKVDLMSGDNQMYCNICNKLNNSLYASSIYSLPIYLIINLNRGKGAVYECKVNFPEQLNLYNYASFKDGYTAYGLYAVICHLGPSSMSGHFVAYCRNRIDNQWYLYNDGIVTSCTRPQQYKDGMPYILFYKALTIE